MPNHENEVVNWMQIRIALEKGMANHFSILALRTPWTIWKGRKIGHLKKNKKKFKKKKEKKKKDELPRSVGAQYATGDQWRNNSRKNEGVEPKQKHYPAVGGIGDRRFDAVKSNIA